mgnify:CR=1 FL=1
MIQQKRRLLLLFLAILVVCMLLAVGVGTITIPPRQTVQIIWSALSGSDLTQFGAGSTILLNLRLPRVLLAALVGAALAAAGTAFQAFFCNPLADPYIVGVSAGAALGATIVLGFQLAIFGSQAVAVTVSSFTGAVAVSYLVYWIAQRRAGFSSLVLLLAGMAVSAFLSAVISLLMVIKSKNLSETVFWLMGGLAGRGWREVGLAFPLVTIGFLALWKLSKELNLLLLSTEEAQSLGLDVQSTRRKVLALGSLLAAAAVSVSGLIGFVGLIVPHLVRLILGPDHRYLLPGSLLFGSILLVLADLVARTVAAPLELPVGAITSLCGGPFFLYLLVQAKQEQ